MRYYINKRDKTEAYNVVHHATCLFLPHENDRVDLGEFVSINAAILNAKLIHKKVIGCSFCSNNFDNE